MSFTPFDQYARHDDSRMFEWVDGAIELPRGNGMGIAVDEAKIARYRVGEPHSG